MNCQTCQSEMPEILVNPPPTNAAQAHLNSCPVCREELASLQNTFALLDAWEVPEPSPYFDQKLAVRLREEQSMPSVGWFERLRTRLLLNTSRRFQPALAGFMALILLVGGGALAGISNLPDHENRPQVSAAVDDLQILDKNEQALQEMDQLFQDDDTPDDSSFTSPRS